MPMAANDGTWSRTVAQARRPRPGVLKPISSTAWLSASRGAFDLRDVS